MTITVTSELDETATFMERAVARHISETLHLMMVRGMGEAEAAERAWNAIADPATDYRDTDIELPSDPFDYELTHTTYNG